MGSIHFKLLCLPEDGEAVVPASGYDPEVHLSFADVRVNDRSPPRVDGGVHQSFKNGPFPEGNDHIH